MAARLPLKNEVAGLARMKQLVVALSLVAFLVTWLSYTSLETLGESTVKAAHSSGSQRLGRFRSLAAKASDLPESASASFISSSWSSGGGGGGGGRRQGETGEGEGRPGGCVPKKHVFFLKTHKCASSTVQNILMRYAERHDLTLVLPPASNYLGHPIPFQRRMALPAPNGTYDIFCHHTRFNSVEVESLMPSDSVYVSIVRDPVSLFESLFAYFDLGQKWNVELANISVSGSYFNRTHGKFGRNQMVFDFGLEEVQFVNLTAIQNLIKQVAARFDLIMVAERFDESLILLKHLLCWQMEDIIYFRQNARMDGTRRILNESVSGRLREWNMADQMLYDHFSAEFERKVKEFGPERLAAEVAELRRWNSAWYQHCVDRKAGYSELDPQYRSWSSKVLGFHLRQNVQSRLCESMAKAEIAFTTELRYKQQKRSNPPLWNIALRMFL